jgi:cell shape-determining protein MreC
MKLERQEIKAEIVEKRIYKKLATNLRKENKQLRKVMKFVKEQAKENRTLKKYYESNK